MEVKARIETHGVIGSEYPRIDAVEKVTGRASYGSDQAPSNAAHAYLVTATIARGRIREIDTDTAFGMPGVLEILTYQNVGNHLKPGKHMSDFGYMATKLAPLRSNRIYFAGQIVAVVIADTLEQARAAAHAIGVKYATKRPSASLDARGTKIVKAKGLGEPELSAGNFPKAYRASPFKVDAWYETPAQHHNPMEIFQTTCAWNGDQLTVWESSQSVRGYQHGLAKQLGIKPKNIRVISPFIGGAFGSRGELSQYTALIALASRRIGRPVQFVASRQQCFTLRTFRAETRHHLRISADPNGRLTALSHDSWELTSRTDRFAVMGSDSTARLYACPNIRTKVLNVEADRQTPGFMRAPPETPYLFALECAMDELAYALKFDPIELRNRNDTIIDPVSELRYTSRSLIPCIRAGADAFGWRHRDPRPRSMQDRDDFVGWGYATALYPAMLGPAECRVTLTPDLRAIVEVGTHEIGTGIRTVVAQTASDILAIDLSAVEVRTGDSTLPAAPLSAGSNSTASVCNVVAKACQDLRSLIGPTPRPGKRLIARATNTPHGVPPLIGPALIRRGKVVMKGGSMMKDRLQFSFGAQFVEVRVNRWTGDIRATRLVGAFAAGRIMNPKTARSQLAGGQIWGMSAALLESAELDNKLARYVNDNLSDYHVPVNADVLDVQTLMLDEDDGVVNPLGIKGVGELGTTGMNAAIANAVFHATGVRCRKLPIRVDSHLDSLARPKAGDR